MFLLSELVRANQIKVVLTGEGADEFFAGYDLFKENKIRRFWARQPDSTVRPRLLSRIHAYVRGGASQSTMWQAYFRQGLADVEDPFYSHRPRWANIAWSLRFLTQGIREQHRRSAEACEAAMASCLPTGALARAQAIELTTFLASYLLCSQGDRVAMGHGVETRYPFLDPEVTGFAESLPPGLLLRGLNDKLPLRRLGSRCLPEEIWTRPKWPYRAPVSSALFGAGSCGLARAHLSEQALRRSSMIDARAASAMASRLVGVPGASIGEREEMALAGLLTLQIWDQLFFAGFEAATTRYLREFAGVSPDIFEDRRSPSRGGKPGEAGVRSDRGRR